MYIKCENNTLLSKYDELERQYCEEIMASEGNFEDLIETAVSKKKYIRHPILTMYLQKY